MTAYEHRHPTKARIALAIIFAALLGVALDHTALASAFPSQDAGLSAADGTASAVAPQQSLCSYIAATGTFDEVPFNENDIVVFSTLAYLNFDASPDASEPGWHCVGERIDGIDTGKLIAKSWLYDFHGEELVSAVRSSRRFAGIGMEGFVNEVSQGADSQFCAMRFSLPDDSILVVFRGTDNSVAGWKEDADASYKENTPSQEKALAYLEETAARYPEADLILAGHSKGGNLAEYAAATCQAPVFDRVGAVYNLDGPGFVSEPQGRFGTDGYRRKLVKLAPEESIFGRMFDKRENVAQPVMADGDVIAQHATTNWLVGETEPMALDAFSTGSDVLASTFNEWVSSYDPAEREALIGTVFDVVYSAGLENWVDFKDSPLTVSHALIRQTASLPQDERDAVFSAIGKLAGDLGGSAAKQAVGVEKAC